MNSNNDMPDGNGVRPSVKNISAGKSRAGKYIAVVFLMFAGCFGAGLAGGFTAIQLGITPTLISHGVNGDGNAIMSSEERNLAAVASEVGKSVVSITTTSEVESTLFGSRQQQGAGSGIVITKNGYILTNKHVVSGSKSVTVVTSDGTVHENVKVVGTDPLNDLAFLKMSGVSDMKPAELGDSSTVRIGQGVLAIGNTLGEFQNTVTSGIISGTGRPIAAAAGGGDVESLTDLIQTDAAINPGNSGGPLVNLSGQVIGINTAIVEDAQSIGFSIPVNSAKGLIKHLKKTGKVQRGYIGVTFYSITPEYAKDNDLPVKRGAYISSDEGSSVVRGGPAQKAGIKDGDIITKVGDLIVGKHGGLLSLVSEYAIGDTVPLTVLRGGNELKVNVTLQEYSAN